MEDDVDEKSREHWIALRKADISFARLARAFSTFFAFMRCSQGSGEK